MKDVAVIFFALIFSISVSMEAEASPHWFSRKKPAYIVFQSIVKKGKWTFVDKIPLSFNAHHTQGLVKIGDDFYLSSVEVEKKPSKFFISRSGEDRTPGEGRAHLFHFDGAGKLIKELVLGMGSLYHAGGIDTDGKRIWMPISEYRPNSLSIIYEIKAKDFEGQEIFRFADHIGNVAYEPFKKKLHLVNWGARMIQPVDMTGRRLGEAIRRNDESKPQDCHFAGDNAMLCGGWSDPFNPLNMFMRRGQIVLYDLGSYRILDRIEAPWNKKEDLPMTRNAMAFEVIDDHMRFYFLPEDGGKSMLYVYDLK